MAVRWVPCFQNDTCSASPEAPTLEDITWPSLPSSFLTLQKAKNKQTKHSGKNNKHVCVVSPGGAVVIMSRGGNQQPAYCANSVSRWCGIIGCWASDWCGAAWQAQRRTAPDLQDLVSGKECRSRALIGRAPCRSWGVVGSAVRGTAGGGWGRRETVGERWKQACWLF